ncbi:MAG: ABC transporter ATP-binding protein, partial [Algoriphagus sp.]|nr:ABC transporter ATP-binding protein [Algoriphagus sp.]
IIVSHDRYFMDRLVEHLFVFEGEGVIRDFPGNYTDFREWEKENENSIKNQVISIKTPLTKSEIKETTIEKQESAPKIKASFKQKQEFKKVTESIAKLEAEKAKLTDQISAGAPEVDQLMAWSNRLQAIDSEMEELELVWLELSELDGIE